MITHTNKKTHKCVYAKVMTVKQPATYHIHCQNLLPSDSIKAWCLSLYTENTENQYKIKLKVVIGAMVDYKSITN